MRVIPTEVIRYGGETDRGTDLKLSLTTPRGPDFLRADDKKDEVYLFVTDHGRYTTLIKEIGAVVSGKVDGDKVSKIRILRNSPLQYIGTRVINVNGRTYNITAKQTVTGRESLERASINQIAGLEDSDVNLARNCLGNFLALNTIISERGQALRPGLTLALTLTGEDSLRFRRNGAVCTSPIEKLEGYEYK
jgi:hypothetical protein